MVFVAGKGSAVVVAEFDLSSDFTGYNFGKSRQLPDVTTMGLDDKVFLAGVGEGSISVQGVWNAATDQSDEELNNLDGTETVITASPQGFATIGDRAHMVNGFIENYQPRATQNDAVRFSAGIKSSAGAYTGQILHPDIQRSTPADFGSIDGTAQSTFGATAFLHVTEFNGTDATVTIEDAVTEPTYGSLVAFTQATGLTSEKVTVAGNVERFTRIALTGTFTTVTFVVSFVRHLF